MRVLFTFLQGKHEMRCTTALMDESSFALSLWYFTRVLNNSSSSGVKSIKSRVVWAFRISRISHYHQVIQILGKMTMHDFVRAMRMSANFVRMRSAGTVKWRQEQLLNSHIRTSNTGRIQQRFRSRLRELCLRFIKFTVNLQGGLSLNTWIGN